MGSAGAFRYRVLVSMKGIPSHARSSEMAQRILGSCCAKAEIAGDEALAAPDDELELFIAAWCAHPDLVPDEVIMAIPEPEEDHDGGPSLFLRPHEIIHDEVLALRYLVRLRLIEFQDWHTPPRSSDDEMYDGDTSDPGDSNHNGYHPGFCTGGGGAQPRTTRFSGPSEPLLGPGPGPAFRARESRRTIVVGDVHCPLVASRVAPIPLCSAISAMPATRGTRVAEPVVDTFDFGCERLCSPPAVNSVLEDPMLAEARLRTPLKGVSGASSASDCNALVHSVDIWPRGRRSP